MHENSYNLMKDVVAKYNLKDKKVLDVGSYNVNGSYKDLFSNYTGLDIEAGPNVDIVAKSLYDFGVPDNSFDVVISGQTLEHVEDMKRWILEVARVAKEMVVVIAPSRIGYHRYPIDCWRIYPDGMKWLFTEAGLETLEVDYHKAYNPAAGYIEDTIGIAKV